MQRTPEWIAKEADLWRRLMDPRTPQAEGWKVYREWIEHR